MINLHECQVPVLFHSLNRMVFVLAKLFLTCFLVKLVWTQKPGHFQQNPHVSQFFENAGQVVNSDEESRRRERLLGQARQEIAISFSTTLFCLKLLFFYHIFGKILTPETFQEIGGSIVELVDIVVESFGYLTQMMPLGRIGLTDLNFEWSSPLLQTVSTVLTGMFHIILI